MFFSYLIGNDPFIANFLVNYKYNYKNVIFLHEKLRTRNKEPNKSGLR